VIEENYLRWLVESPPSQLVSQSPTYGPYGNSNFVTKNIFFSSLKEENFVFLPIKLGNFMSEVELRKFFAFPFYDKTKVFNLWLLPTNTTSKSSTFFFFALLWHLKTSQFTVFWTLLWNFSPFFTRTWNFLFGPTISWIWNVFSLLQPMKFSCCFEMFFSVHDKIRIDAESFRRQNRYRNEEIVKRTNSFFFIRLENVFNFFLFWNIFLSLKFWF
jgi:hypothetical protein